MSTLSSLLSVARDGMIASNAAIQIASQNIAGASTPGYVRRSAVLEERAQGGVRVGGIARSFDGFAQARLLDQESFLADARERAGALGALEGLVSPAYASIGERADALFSSFRELAMRPSDATTRATVLTRAESLAAGFAETARGIESLRTELLGQADGVAKELNGRLEQLASLDRQILAAGDGAEPLRDRRDQTIREISERIGGHATYGKDGSVTLFGAGGVLYEGGSAAKLRVELDVGGNLQVNLERGGRVTDITNGLAAGSLAGIREARDVDLPRAQADLDALAYETGQMLNGIHAGGVGLDGTGNRALFDVGATPAGAAKRFSVHVDVKGHPERLAAAGAAGNLPGGSDVASKLAHASDAVLAGGGTVSHRYISMVGSVGRTRQAADGDVALREDTVATTQAARESVSGVSADEEFIQLQQFQRAFEASARVLRTVDELFDSLLRSF
jgi:flagellar hook-associated protein 1 FlgK